MKVFCVLIFFVICGCVGVRNASTDYPVIYKDLEKALKNRGKVIALSLAGSDLKDFPMLILELENLEYLNLSLNEISSLPKDINKLEKLKTLDLMGNRIEELPVELSCLKNLRRVNIAYNPVLEEDLRFLKESLLDCLFIYYLEL
ncbi:leucine-rich repeat domain-containing protein [Algoriphagus sp. H41]|uniref:Leucine-rich repeat domain-containing protein n=1 Tax=Algoriphagus oliviformis TaxID=2811231 RepID=A0ABS3C453_9BACT|nr:leucine-rich repeat domain-containing protein [Algoriphagus oliviformis]MBN7811742.1 leucine-rich repeat domain-containing protein [Algoriphagus oliviformis]